MASKEFQTLNDIKRTEQHLQLLQELDKLDFEESCCDICHCDCYSSRRSALSCDDLHQDSSHLSCDSNNNQKIKKKSSMHRNVSQFSTATTISRTLSNPNLKQKLILKQKPNVKVKVKTKTKNDERKSLKRSKVNASAVSLNETFKKPFFSRRSKSASSLRSRSQSPNVINTTKLYTRDCKILQDILTTIEPSPRFEITGSKELSASKDSNEMYASSRTLPHRKSSRDLGPLRSLKLCNSMANLCLEPKVREAFQLIPEHDQKILNRMASKRSEQALSKENAWLARKYWENERYERELLKYEQMEEYKKAIRDKQFQDYLQTKERLNAIAQKDFAELQRLKHALNEKDKKAKQRIESLRLERDLQICQRRCDELRKAEAINIHQEGQNLEETLRKRDACERLTQRLRKASDIRNQTIESYLTRLRHDNYLEQIVHEEHWRDAQTYEQVRKEQLKEHINYKRSKSQRFIESKQKKNAAQTNTAKIAANLRELVRTSVTPESAFLIGNSNTNLAGPTLSSVHLNLGKFLFDRPISNLSLQY